MVEVRLWVCCVLEIAGTFTGVMGKVVEENLIALGIFKNLNNSGIQMQTKKG